MTRAGEEVWDGTARGYLRWWRSPANRRYARRSAWERTKGLLVVAALVLAAIPLVLVALAVVR